MIRYSKKKLIILKKIAYYTNYDNNFYKKHGNDIKSIFIEKS